MTQDTTDTPLETALRELVIRARQGDSGAYTRLLSEVAPVIRRLVTGWIGRWGQPLDAEDVTQDTLLTLHVKLHTYDPALPFLAWVHAVTRHRLIDTLRRRKGVTLSFDEATLATLADSANPDAPSIVLDLHTLLGQLKPPAGEIIYALKVEGASLKEIATAHNLSETNVKVIVHRGLQKLARFVRATCG